MNTHKKIPRMEFDEDTFEVGDTDILSQHIHQFNNQDMTIALNTKHSPRNCASTGPYQFNKSWYRHIGVEKCPSVVESFGNL